MPCGEIVKLIIDHDIALVFAVIGEKYRSGEELEVFFVQTGSRVHVNGTQHELGCLSKPE